MRELSSFERRSLDDYRDDIREAFDHVFAAADGASRQFVAHIVAEAVLQVGVILATAQAGGLPLPSRSALVGAINEGIKRAGCNEKIS